LLDGFEAEMDGVSTPLTFSVQSVVSYLALRGPTERHRVATALWPEVDRGQASARLRTAIWRALKSGLDLIRTTPAQLALAAGVDVDVHQLLDASYRAVAQVPPRTQLWGELLPGWYEDWVILEREQFRERRVNALEALAERLLAEKQYAASMEVAMACIAAEPLREGGHRIAARVHLAERNYSEAVRHIESYLQLLYAEIEDTPSRQIAEMLEYARLPRSLLT
jgi:DNA-binding SARP family transcriptional activator